MLLKILLLYLISIFILWCYFYTGFIKEGEFESSVIEFIVGYFFFLIIGVPLIVFFHIMGMVEDLKEKSNENGKRDIR